MMVSVIDALTQAGVVLVAITISFVGGGFQTSATHTSEHPIIATRPFVMPAMSFDEQKRMKRFQRLFPLDFEGGAS